ncbi:MAG TPA: response regulator transcription factor [Candidatus Saccharimonadales bacterium]|nr:response regulator transcription factor [Candidatus Saccharimonadales bacterium]
MRLLVVEDEKKIADALKKGLEQETYAVDVAYDGEYGYDLAASEDYDLIILDLMLPKMDGMEICRKLREENKQTPVLMLTARGSIGDKVTGLNTGADDYLAKPFAFEELLARVRALNRRPKQLSEEILKVDDLVVDTISHQVSRREKEIDLSKKEFSLLTYLAKNKGRVVTKGQIISKVWDFDSDVLPNTVEVYIGYLRDKIDKPFPDSKQLIKTVRGFGYRLD